MKYVICSLQQIELKSNCLSVNKSLVFLLIIQQEGLMEWHSSTVPRTRIRVIGVIFSDHAF